MSGLDLYEREAAERVNRMTPIDRPQVGTWDGFLRGTGMAAMRTFAKTARAVDMAGAVGPIVQDAFTGGTEAQDRYFREHDETFGSAVDFWTAKPGEVGVAGEIAGQLLATIPQVVMSPSLTVAATQLGTAEDLVQKGVDATKAQIVGGVQGAGLGLGIYMPIFGKSLWQRMLVGGAGFNVMQGAAMRGVSEQVLKGTAAEGDFRLLDSDAFTLDLLLGAAFGGISHLSPRQRAEGERMWTKLQEWGLAAKEGDREALAVLRQAQHSNVDSLPGRPLESQDLNAHVERVRAAVDQLVRDQRVEVTDLPAARVEADGKRWAEGERRANQLVREAEKLGKQLDIAPRSDEEPAPVAARPDAVTEPAGPLVDRDAGSPPSASGEPARPAATDAKPDPLAMEAERIAADRPDLQVTVGLDETGTPIRKPVKDVLAEAKAETVKAAQEANLMEVAAYCLFGRA